MRHASPLLITLGLAAASLGLHAAPPQQLRPLGPAGAYTTSQWKLDWPGCEWEDGVQEGHMAITERAGVKAFRVNYQPGEIGPEKGGVGWRFPFAQRLAAELRYTVRFSKDFDWVKGGKLPGLCGGPENVSGGKPATGANGFSARLMWRADGRGEAYVYHMNQKGSYGDSFAFPEDFRFPTDAPVQVRLAVSMNQPGQRDGTLRVWITLDQGVERLVVDRADMAWRSVDSFGVNGVYFDTFHGGGDRSWAPTRPCWAEFSSLSISDAVVKP